MYNEPPGLRTRRSSRIAAASPRRRVGSAPSVAVLRVVHPDVLERRDRQDPVVGRVAHRQLAQVGVDVGHVQERERLRLGRERDDVQLLDARAQPDQHVRVVQRRAGVEHAAAEVARRAPRELDHALVEADAVADRAARGRS